MAVLVLTAVPPRADVPGVRSTAHASLPSLLPALMASARWAWPASAEVPVSAATPARVQTARPDVNVQVQTSCAPMIASLESAAEPVIASVMVSAHVQSASAIVHLEPAHVA